MSRTFFEMYREAVVAPSPRQVFLGRVMAATGCSYETAQKWAYGKKRPTDDSKERLSVEFDIPVEELFPGN